MKILRLSTYCYPERISSSHMTADFETACAAQGITLDTYAPTPTRGVSAEEREQYKQMPYEERLDGTVIIHRFPMYREGKNPIARALRYMLVSLKHYYHGCRAEDIDLIMGSTTPPTQGVLCAMVAKRLSRRYKRHVPFVFTIQDMFPESLVSTGMCREGSLLYRIGSKISDYSYRHADRVLVITDSMKQRLIDKGVPEDKVQVARNWVDTEAVHPIPREENTLYEEFSLPRDGFCVTYAGNLGASQNPGLLVDCAERLAHRKDIHFVIFGGGSEKERLEQRIAGSGLTNIRLLPMQPAQRVAEVYSLGDASFVLCRKGVGLGAFPSKSASIMAAGTPVIASFDAESDLCRIVEREQVGLCAPAEDADAAVEAILRLADDPDRCRQYGENARKTACSQFSKEVCTAVRIAAYREVAGQ